MYTVDPANMDDDENKIYENVSTKLKKDESDTLKQAPAISIEGINFAINAATPLTAEADNGNHLLIVTKFDNEDKFQETQQLRPEVFAKGGDEDSCVADERISDQIDFEVEDNASSFEAPFTPRERVDSSIV